MLYSVKGKTKRAGVYKKKNRRQYYLRWCLTFERKWFEYLVCKEIKKWTACSESYSIRWKSWQLAQSHLSSWNGILSMVHAVSPYCRFNFVFPNRKPIKVTHGLWIPHISPSPNGRWFTHQPGEGSLNILNISWLPNVCSFTGSSHRLVRVTLSLDIHKYLLKIDWNLPFRLSGTLKSS